MVPYLHCTVCIFYTQDMLTLNQATGMTKKVAVWTAIIMGTLITLIILFRIGVWLKNIISPTPPPPPTVLYGLLPVLELPNNLGEKNYSYIIDTVTGGLPKFSDRAKVFKIVPLSINLLALKKTGQDVAQAGFTNGPARVSGNVYQWTDPISAIGKKINVDIFSSEFSVSSTFLNDPNVQNGTYLPNPDEAIKLAQNFLSGMEVLPNDIKTTKPYYYSIQNSQLTPASSIGDAQVIEIDFFQQDFDNLPIYYPRPYNSTMNIFIGGGETRPQILQAQYFHQEVSTESATYPIKTAEEAFIQLKDGKAYIANPASPGKDEIFLQEISLAYYMSDKAQDYLMPIVVFKGTDGFIAYLSAVKDEWINK